MNGSKARVGVVLLAAAALVASSYVYGGTCFFRCKKRTVAFSSATRCWFWNIDGTARGDFNYSNIRKLWVVTPDSNQDPVAGTETVAEYSCPVAVCSHTCDPPQPYPQEATISDSSQCTFRVNTTQ